MFFVGSLVMSSKRKRSGGGGGGGSSKRASSSSSRAKGRAGKGKQVAVGSGKSSLGGKSLRKDCAALEPSKNFCVNMEFTNHLPRPIVGPVFLPPPTSMMENYKASDVERWWSWRLHYEKDLGCKIHTIDPKYYQPQEPAPAMDPGDDFIVNWRGYLGDTEGEKVRYSREGKILKTHRGQAAVAGKEKKNSQSSSSFRGKIKRSDVKGSRVLDEPTQFFMKKTTYLDNNLRKSAHEHKSLMDKRNKEAVELEGVLREGKTRVSERCIFSPLSFPFCFLPFLRQVP